jgi:uncharacterized protein YdeI (YjbR/CyaY-like superfamily)
MAKTKHHPGASLLITEYIDALPPFSREICVKLRELIHAAIPDVIEDWKWGPNFYYHGMVCGFGAFKSHVAIAFFQGAMLKDPHKILITNPGNHHNRNIKFTDVKDVKATILKAYLKEAAANNKAGVVVKITPEEKVVVVPDDLKKALAKLKLTKAFEELAYYKRKEMVMWINDAKREETRLKRLEKVVDLVDQRKGLNDHYK